MRILPLFMVLALSSVTARAKDWIDITGQYITNPGFDNNSNAGWTYTSDASSQTVRAECMEFWNGSFNIYQTVKNLPSGHYRMSVQSYYRVKDNQNGYSDYTSGQETITGYMYAGSNEQQLKSVYSQEYTENLANGCWAYRTGGWFDGSTTYFPNTMEAAAEAFSRGDYQNQMEFDHDGGDLQMGLRCSDWQNNNWCIFDNFKLELYGDVILPTSLNITFSHTSLTVGEQEQATVEFVPSDVTYTALTWESSDSNVATVDSKGNVTAVAPGTCTIVATTTDGSSLSVRTTITVSRNEPTAESLVINEIMSGNFDQYISPDFNFLGWMELYNPSDRPVSLEGLHVSDDSSDPAKWTFPAVAGVIPAKGYKVVWFDDDGLSNTSVNFKLDADGGQIIISSADGKTIASQSYPEAKERVAYARTADGSDTWAETSYPTPGASNSSSEFASSQLDAPVVDTPSKLFTGSMSVNVSIPDGATLRYTTDGSLPTMTNGETSTTGQFDVTSTTVYRFRLFKEGSLASPVTSRSYIMNDREYYLPIVSVISDNDFLYDDSIGVMVRGVNGVAGNGQSSLCNWNMPWQRAVNFSYITADGDMALNQDVWLEMCGGWSRAWTPHSFKLKGNKLLGGNKNLNYPFFSAKPYIRNRTLQIRNGGNDNNCRIKDPALETIIQTSGIDIDLQSYEPVHEFINGQYIGVLNVREPNNKHYVYANYGWDDDEIDQFEMSPDSGYVQKAGTKEAFSRLVSLSADAANSSTYEEIKQLLDIDEYINYMAMEFYIGCTDWPQNNIKGFRNTDDGKFRFVSFDLDGSLATNDPFNAFQQKQNYTFDRLYNRPVDHITAEIEMVTMFLNLLNNSDFRRQFIDTYCLMGGSVFEPTRANAIIDSLCNRVYPAMSLENASPWSTATNIKRQLSNRLSSLINALQNYSAFQLSGSTQQSVKLGSNVSGARIEVNGINVPTGKFDGILFQPVTLRAVAPAGYTFRGWRETGTVSGTEVFGYNSDWSYYDQGNGAGSSWYTTAFDASGWSVGTAPLGYGKDVTTTISYGDNASNKYPTYYFRKSFSLDNKPASDLSLNYIIDDGFIVYVNGQEAGRYNMPSGTVDYSTYASSYAPSNPDTGTMTLAASLFQKGENTIAVEVHNNSATSTDIEWAAQLMTPDTDTDTGLYSDEAEISMPSGDVSLTAVYEPLDDDELKSEGCLPVRINEVSTGNDVYVNDYFKKADWIELYNTTSADIDLEGMYLSNDASDKHLSPITGGDAGVSTIIPAHGYKVVWCDKKAPAGQLHADFKITAGEGTLYLTAADDSWTDEFSYTAFDGYHSEGRYPDGSNSLYVMEHMTIGKANEINTYASFAGNQTPATDIAGVSVSAAHKLSVGYASGNVIIRSSEATSAKVSVYTLSGQLVMSRDLSLGTGVNTMPVSSLQRGSYIVKVTTADSKASAKFVF